MLLALNCQLKMLELPCSSWNFAVLDIKKGQPECILQDLFRVCAVHHGVHSRLVDFHINLLSLIEEDMEKVGLSGYGNLGPSRKLNILNFLCDEVLGTKKLRIWIDEVSVKFDGERKENKEKVLPAKRKEKFIRWMDEKAKAMVSASEGTPLSQLEFDDLLSQLKFLHLLNLYIRIYLFNAVRPSSSPTMMCKMVLTAVLLADSCFFVNFLCRPRIISVYSLTIRRLKESDRLRDNFRNPKRVRHPTDDVEDGVKSEPSDSPESEHGLPQDR